VKNLANKITMVRLIASAVVLVALMWGTGPGLVVALLVFVGSALSDWLDGYLARRRGEVSTWGKIMDPVADKVLVYAVFLWALWARLLPVWMVMVLLGRDFVVMGLRVELAARGVVLAAGWWGKVKTVLQDTVIILLLLLVGRQSGALSPTGTALILGLMGAVVVATIVSGAQYALGAGRTVS